MKHVLDVSANVRFAAHASLQSLSCALPDDVRQRLASVARVEPAAIDVPDVSRAAEDVRDACGARCVAVAVSRLVGSKRVEVAVEAVGRLHPRVQLVVVGDGPDRDRLSKLAGAWHVRFEGKLPREDALAWVAAADVVVHTSAEEAAPTVIREARSLGVLVVACDAGDVSRWAREDPGIVVVPPSPDDVALAIRRFVE